MASPQRSSRSPRRRWYILAGAGVLLAALVGGPYNYLARAPIRRHPVAFNFAEAMRTDSAPVFANHVTEHVIIISVDGLRADALARLAPPAITRLAREGAVSVTAQTIEPSLTLPSHTSMLTGTEPSVHGITWNTDLTSVRGRALEVPTVFAIAKARGLRTAAFFSKSKFHHLEDLEALDYSQSPDGGWGKIFAYRTADDAVRYLERNRPHLMFVHLADPDYTGHALKWMSGPYARAVRAADGAVARIVVAADSAFGRGEYVIILSADHGGVGRSHGAKDPRNSTIPWIAWGEGVRPRTTLPPGIRTTYTAATAMWLLGIPIPAQMSGVPVTAAFRGALSAPAAQP
jgi:hypothetical protein